MGFFKWFKKTLERIGHGSRDFSLNPHVLMRDHTSRLSANDWLWVSGSTHVVLAVLIKILFNKHRANRHTHVRIDLGYAVFPSRRRLLSAEENIVKLLLHLLETIVQVIYSVPHESPQEIIRHCSAKVTNRSSTLVINMKRTWGGWGWGEQRKIARSEKRNVPGSCLG